MLPSVTSFHRFLNTGRYSLSNYAADHALALLVASEHQGLLEALSKGPHIRHTSPCTPHSCLCKQYSSLLSKPQAPMPASPAISTGVALGTSNSTHPCWTHCLSPSDTLILFLCCPSEWLTSISMHLAAWGMGSGSPHLHPLRTHVLWIWPPTVLFHLPSLPQPVAMVSVQPTAILPSMAPAPSSARLPPTMMPTGVQGSSWKCKSDPGNTLLLVLLPFTPFQSVGLTLWGLPASSSPHESLTPCNHCFFVCTSALEALEVRDHVSGPAQSLAHRNPSKTMGSITSFCHLASKCDELYEQTSWYSTIALFPG